MSGEDRVSYNPVSGESQTLYDAPEDFQLYADQMGFEPGTDEYNDAMADYVLRTSGPTAQTGRQYLENLRQQNRLAVTGERQKRSRERREGNESVRTWNTRWALYHKKKKKKKN